MHEWESLPEVEWDEESALLVWDTDTYLFNIDDLREYVESSGLSLELCRFQLCQMEPLPFFRIQEWLYDYLDEDVDKLSDTLVIDRRVNHWIANHVPRLWTPISARPSLQSLKDAMIYPAFVQS